MASRVTVNLQQILARKVSEALDRLPEGWEENVDENIKDALEDLNYAVQHVITYGSSEHQQDLATVLDAQIAGKNENNMHVALIDRVSSALRTIASIKDGYFKSLEESNDSTK